MIRNMSDNSRTENNRNEDSKAEKLFRAMSGADEELLLRSEQNGSSNTGKLHKFPMRYVARIAAACLCFAVAGVLYMTMSSTKMADSTGSAEMAAAQLADSITADTAMPEVNEAARAEQAGSDGISGEDTAGAAMSGDMADAAAEGARPDSAAEAAAELPEGAATESASELSGGAIPELSEGTGTEGTLEAARQESTVTEGAMSEAADSGAPEKQDSQMSAVVADSCCDGGMVESSTEASDEMQEEEVMEKQGRHLPGKMTRKGQ